MKAGHHHIKRAIRAFAPLLNSRAAAVASRRTRSETRRRDLARAQAWFGGGNIVGMYIGPKVSGSAPGSGPVCLKFIVRRKLTNAALRAGEAIPPSLRLETIRREMLTDVVAWKGAPRAHAFPRERPLHPGLSIGHPRGDGGTLGLVVRRAGDAQPCLLSCAHVLAAGFADKGDPIEQPSDEGGDNSNNVVGTLADFSAIETGIVNQMDAAIARLNDSVQTSTADPALGAPTDVLDSQGLADTSLVLARNGLGSGLQQGNVEGHSGVINLFYEDLGQTVPVANLVVYNAPCAGGDSGAAVFVDGTTTVAGLHVGGIQEAARSVCTPIQLIFDNLGLTL